MSSTIVELESPMPADGSLSTTRSIWRDCVFEFVGTFVFVYISLAGVNQSILTNSQSQLSIALCFALGISSGIIVSQDSGAHLNPAVSATVYLTSQEFGTMRLIGYTCAQIAGAFSAGVLVLAVYYSWMNNFVDESIFYGAFGTVKNPNNKLGPSILDQFVGSALLMLGILYSPSNNLKPIAIGSVLGGLALFQGSNGFAFNPARDLGPRLASSIVYGSNVFTAEDDWFWVPMVIPYFGILFGKFIHYGLTHY